MHHYKGQDRSNALLWFIKAHTIPDFKGQSGRSRREGVAHCGCEQSMPHRQKGAGRALTLCCGSPAGEELKLLCPESSAALSEPFLPLWAGGSIASSNSKEMWARPGFWALHS